MGRLISILILVIDILAIIDVLKSHKDSEKKLLWIIAIIFLPVVGPILWYFVGRKN